MTEPEGMAPPINCASDVTLRARNAEVLVTIRLVEAVRFQVRLWLRSILLGNAIAVTATSLFSVQRSPANPVNHLDAFIA